jgi:hypothetical protein
VANSFSQPIVFDKTTALAVIVPRLRPNGMYYEVNIKGFPRFLMAWSALGRYDVADDEDQHLPYPLVLAVSDAIERHIKRR